MSPLKSAAVLAVLLTGCGGADANTDVPRGSDAKASSGSRPRAEAPATSTVATGTALKISIDDQYSSRTAKPGERVRATLTANVTDSRGRVVIPTGSAVTLTIVKLEPGSDQVRPEGRLELATASIMVHGQEIPLHATVGDVPHRMQGRGITTDEAARVAGGAAVGAAIGQIIGKNTKGTVIGGAVGTVAGGAVAAKYAYRDVVIDKGAVVTLTLTEPITLKML